MTILEILLFINVLFTLLVALIVLFRKPTGSTSQSFQQELSALGAEIGKLAPASREEFARNREESQRSSKDTREELGNSFTRFSEGLSKSFQGLLSQQTEQNAALKEELTKSLKESRDESAKASRDVRTELTNALKSFEEKFAQNVNAFNDLQRQKFGDLAEKQGQVKTEIEAKLEMIRETVEKKIGSLQEENSKKLDEMRNTVDEKLQSTVEKRFNDSFKLISDRLEQVHKGLGEMQTLASGVGDLKKVLTNIKTRGTFGEIQLGNILEEIFTPNQYDKNATVRPGGTERVEYAIKLPGRNDDNQSLLLPIDSKFPMEDYQGLIDAYENVTNFDQKAVEGIATQFEGAVRKCARDIREKYINPPFTTDFAILFVPTEGLYAEILRRPGFSENLRREYKVTVVGPTNLVAFLNSLQMGFRTLAIEKRTSEVWEVLGAVKTEFSKFNVVLERTKRKLVEATNSIDSASIRTRAIERQLRKVQELPQEEATALIGHALELEADIVKDEELENPEEK